MIKKLVGLALLICSIGANAALVDHGTYTTDTQTGLDWLDVSLTTNQTFDQVRTGAWYQAGYRYATRAEVELLFMHAGTPDDNFDISVTHPAETLALINLLGETLPSRTLGFVGTDYWGATVTLQNHPIGSVFSALLAKVDYMDFGKGPIGEAHFSGGQPFSNESDPAWGSFLVRPSVVPIPATGYLFLSGIAGLYGVKRRLGKYPSQ